MSPSGHSRRFDSQPLTSALPRKTDIIGPFRHVSNVPTSDIEDAEPRNEKPPEGGFLIRSLTIAIRALFLERGVLAQHGIRFLRNTSLSHAICNLPFSVGNTYRIVSICRSFDTTQRIFPWNMRLFGAALLKRWWQLLLSALVLQ
jgi:hypothetical protein